MYILGEHTIMNRNESDIPAATEVLTAMSLNSFQILFYSIQHIALFCNAFEMMFL